MTHGRYALFFLLVAVAAVYWACTARFILVCGLMVWLVVSCLWTAMAFLRHRPEMLMGKRQNGSTFLPFCLINGPFLLIYWLVWTIRHFLLSHEPVHTVAGTNVSISCWPGFHVPLDNYDLVLDVTSEMPKWYRCPNARYVCLPNLDGVPLDHFELPFKITSDMRILVHCAQGRGRSALMTCLILLSLGHARTANEAFEMLKRSRPKVGLTRRQFAQLREFEGSVFSCVTD